MVSLRKGNETTPQLTEFQGSNNLKTFHLNINLIQSIINKFRNNTVCFNNNFFSFQV